MPIEIGELHIRVAVDAADSAPATGGSGASDVDSLVAACVDQVMEILRERRER